ncbi:MAG: hypothetical protein QW756_06430 [Nitrososphaerota archaeon]
MPKKIVVKISGEPPKAAEPETQHEEIPAVEPVAVNTAPSTVVTEPSGMQQIELSEDAKLERALNEYEKLQDLVTRQRLRDRKFQEHCLANDIEPRIIRNILTRFGNERKALAERSKEVLEYLSEAKNVLDSKFAQVEEELVWASIELNTMQMEPSRADKSVGMREELEARIAQLRKELPNLRNRVKALEDKIRELNEFPKTVQEKTTDRETVQKVYEDVKKRFILSYGVRAEAMLRAEIEKVAQAESIPKEYATILVWKRASAGVY